MPIVREVELLDGCLEARLVLRYIPRPGLGLSRQATNPFAEQSLITRRQIISRFCRVSQATVWSTMANPKSRAPECNSIAIVGHDGSPERAHARHPRFWWNQAKFAYTSSNPIKMQSHADKIAKTSADQCNESMCVCVQGPLTKHPGVPCSIRG